MQGKGGRGLNGEGDSVPGARAETRLISEAVCWTAHSMLTATLHLAALEDGNASRGHWRTARGGTGKGDWAAESTGPRYSSPTHCSASGPT